jgi:hypothetical protein
MDCGGTIVAKPTSTKPDQRSSTPQVGSDRPHGSDDPLIKLMRRFNIPVTREDYLNLAYMGEVPSPLSAEQEADLPPEVCRRG